MCHDMTSLAIRAGRLGASTVCFSVVPQYARRHPRHCAPYAAVYAVPQYTAASYTVLLNLGMVSIERFLCGHSDSTKQDFSQNIFFHTVFQKETLLNSNIC